MSSLLTRNIEETGYLVANEMSVYTCGDHHDDKNNSFYDGYVYRSYSQGYYDRQFIVNNNDYGGALIQYHVISQLLLAAAQISWDIYSFVAVKRLAVVVGDLVRGDYDNGT